nr:MAG TPA: hypothetical protein [Bacteriophage sp.]
MVTSNLFKATSNLPKPATKTHNMKTAWPKESQWSHQRSHARPAATCPRTWTHTHARIRLRTARLDATHPSTYACALCGRAPVRVGPRSLLRKILKNIFEKLFTKYFLIDTIQNVKTN